MDQELTAAVEIKLQKGDGAVYAVVVGVLVAELADPGKVGLVDELLEVGDATAQHGLRVVLVEGAEEVDDDGFLLGRELGDGAALWQEARRTRSAHVVGHGTTEQNK